MNGLNPDPGWRLRLRDAVVFAARAEIVEAAHERQDGAVVGIERDERALRLGNLARAPRGRRASRARRRRRRLARRLRRRIWVPVRRRSRTCGAWPMTCPAHSMFAIPSPFDEHLCLFLGDGDDDRRPQDPDACRIRRAADRAPAGLRCRSVRPCWRRRASLAGASSRRGRCASARLAAFCSRPSMVVYTL